MGYTTCLGNVKKRHAEKRACDGCDTCPVEGEYRAKHLYCWKCCGRLTACPKCAQKLAEHIVGNGPPPPEWEKTAGVGYRLALKIVNQAEEKALAAYKATHAAALPDAWGEMGAEWVADEGNGT